MEISEKVVKNKTAAYLLLNMEINERKQMQQAIKEDLEPYLNEAETNARGSFVIPFSEMLEIGGTKYKAVQKVRKESKVLNEDRTLAFLTSDQAFECAIVTVQHVDQDALWNLFVQDMITQEELDGFYDTTVSYSFLPTKE